MVRDLSKFCHLVAHKRLPPVKQSGCLHSLGLLVRKVADNRLQDISQNLCQRVTSESGKKAQQRDIASIGLKTVIAEVSGTQATALVSFTTPLLIEGLSKPVSNITQACAAPLKTPMICIVCFFRAMVMF